MASCRVGSDSSQAYSSSSAKVLLFHVECILWHGVVDLMLIGQHKLPEKWWACIVSILILRLSMNVENWSQCTKSELRIDEL